mmetsp:Transcript_75934/g.197567  ORF Transcript_75934/g.197567 Transcript_75934/m.197567 type:complete len:159 (+) Transcript_75934:181-657(+)
MLSVPPILNLNHRGIGCGVDVSHPGCAQLALRTPSRCGAPQIPGSKGGSNTTIPAKPSCKAADSSEDIRALCGGKSCHRRTPSLQDAAKRWASNSRVLAARVRPGADWVLRDAAGASSISAAMNVFLTKKRKGTTESDPSSLICAGARPTIGASSAAP